MQNFASQISDGGTRGARAPPPPPWRRHCFSVQFNCSMVVKTALEVHWEMLVQYDCGDLAQRWSANVQV